MTFLSRPFALPFPWASQTVIWLLVVTDGGVKILWGEIKTLLILLTILSICFWIFYAQSSYLKIAFETPFSSLIFAMGELFAFKVQKCHIWNRSSWAKMSQKHFKWYQWCGVLFNGFKIEWTLQLNQLLWWLSCGVFVVYLYTECGHNGPGSHCSQGGGSINLLRWLFVSLGGG